MPHPPVTITFLGTGTSSGVPMIACSCPVCQSTNPKDKRLRSSVLIESGSTKIVIDTGPDFRQQMLSNNVKTLDAVLLTHGHKDHIAGLDDIRAYNYFQKNSMDVYASTATIDRVKMEFDYAFSDLKITGVPSIQLHQIDEHSIINIDGLQITPILVWHMYMPVLGYRIGNFSYITDANRIDDASKEKIRGSEVLVLNALRHEEHVSHFTLAEAMRLADELAIPQVYFTHISHQMGFHEEIEATLPPGRNLGYDGLKISL